MEEFQMSNIQSNTGLGVFFGLVDFGLSFFVCLGFFALVCLGLCVFVCDLGFFFIKNGVCYTLGYLT